MPRLEVGQVAPDFTLPSLDGPVTLAEVVASSTAGVIVYFYPKASTPGCTKEACDFRDSLNSLKAAGYSVLGISPDSLGAIEKFKAKEDLNFPLLSDPDKTVMEAWGAWGEKKNYGKVVTGVIRSTIVLDAQQHVTHALYNVKATGHVARLRKELESL